MLRLHHVTSLLRSSSTALRSAGPFVRASTSSEAPVGQTQKDAENHPKSEQIEEKPWENPWKYALPQQSHTYTTYKEVPVDWSEIERLFPMEVVPEVPYHASYPTPSGWQPAANPPPELPYFVRRKRDHTLPLYLEWKKDKLNEKTLDIDHVELVVIRRVEGDLFAFEADLRAYLENVLNHPIATHIDEIKGMVRVREVDRAHIEKFLYKSGF